jgi:membrane protein
VPERDNADAAGREAERPSQIPPRGWFAVLKRVKAEVKEDNVSLLAAGIAFYAMLAIFPAIIALVTIYGMVADPAQVESQVGGLAKSLPSGADQLLTEQLKNVVNAGQQALSIGLGQAGKLAASIVRWVVLALLVLVALAVVYRFAPDRANPRWRWVSGGAVVALLLWLLGSIGFSWYVDKFGNYNQTYGALAAVIILLLWLYLSAFAVLLGAELDAETERQTARDTTTGPERPLGQRNAEVADTLGESTRRR